ncbi:hypothetical protein [Gaoshiqia sediminis]|uniref:Uncharacterized protein n=1 Tax=Gaoshiqia sediminis TaxID=2986998 RepID=A0AA41Y840_9BACT|nr:hypothetical protein [Gaoshiqia sediminis]MCW0483266.1 hypothetical protein [Gaoshiqia sediminis]
MKRFNNIVLCASMLFMLAHIPLHLQPLFGAMKKTSVMPELQITQEYLGHSVQLVYLAAMWKEVFKSDTYQEGDGSTDARTTDGSIFNQKYSVIAGVSNIGLEANWCGLHFAQANWYAFGRQAWSNSIGSDQIAGEWLKLTFGPVGEDPGTAFPAIGRNLNFLEPVKQMMLKSREAAVNYSMPLGFTTFSRAQSYALWPWPMVWTRRNVSIVVSSFAMGL